MTAPAIDVRCEPVPGGWTCSVRIDDGHGAPTTHVITVADADLARLALDNVAPDDLVRRSIGFLLAREPKESILRRFDLPLIGRYFPEYEKTITG